MVVPRISVLMPTLNVMALLPSHIESMRPWLDLVDELIVVDSESTDGTVEYIKRELGGVPVRIESHPRGLYQSWNYGISLAKSEWIYISTVGDSIDRDQLVHLHEVGVASRSDAVISQPMTIDAHDQPLPAQTWPVTELAATVAQNSPRVLSSGAAFFYTLKYLHKSALLGSSASNLYRTAHLQAHPFPADFGLCGDVVWSVFNAFQTRYAITPKIGSTFRFHPKSYSKSEYFVTDYDDLLSKTAWSIYESHAERDDLKALNITQLFRLTDLADVKYRELKALRKRRRPWFIHPEVWRARGESKEAQARLAAMDAQTLNAIRDKYSEVVVLAR